MSARKGGRMTNRETIEILQANYPDSCYEQLRDAVDRAISALSVEPETCMYWDRERIQVFIDNNRIYEIYIKDGTGNTWAFHNRFFLILNVAVGGNWPGWNIDNNRLPAEMLVDYVRVYKLDQTSPYYNSNVPDGYKLVWSDEFDKNYIDTSKWVFDVGGHGWGNNELQFYTSRSENAFIENNQLHIRARRENYGGREYTSARLKTQGKFEFKFGYVEARIALPTFLGACPAFWMLGSSIDAIGWPRCGEIDMLETINEENLVYNTVHWDYNGYTKYGLRTDYIDVTQFHIYSVLWDEEMIRIYVDNIWNESAVNLERFNLISCTHLTPS